MSTLAAPLQTNRRAWADTRIGRFTASTIGALMTEPRSKAAKDAGEWSETAKALISQKAVEYVTGKPTYTHANFSMRRGTLLEHAAIHLMNEHWKPLFECTWIPYGENGGATPDSLLEDNSPFDVKSPESEVQLFEFADQVVEGDWHSLLKWDKNYAWQIAMQALAAGSDHASLAYFSDRVALRQWLDGERDTCNAVMAAIGDQLFNLSGQMYEYHIPPSSEGYGFVARTFEIPKSAFERINEVMERAVVERNRMAERYAELLK